MSDPVAIEVRNVHKSYRIRGTRSGGRGGALSTIQLRRAPGRELPVLRDISFDVRRGEFFGIVGRNGSGKTTLLKLLASVYRADAGRIRVAGRLAPFLELGVGFNPQLPAYENVVMNGVMMGLSLDDARSRYEEIVDFADLRGHTDLPLKNYSAGMKTRLGFSIMTHVDADVLLLDEVLAVGDAEFQEKCIQVFGRMHEQGRTIVLVTHNMQTVNIYCQRALLLHDGVIDRIGDPAAVANRYMELNLQAFVGRAGGNNFADRYRAVLADPPTRIVNARLTDAEGRRVSELDQRVPIELRAEVEILRDVEDPALYFRIDNQAGSALFIAEPVELAPGATARAGERFQVAATVENRLGGGRYVLIATMTQRGVDPDPPDVASLSTTVSFEVTGPEQAGMVTLEQVSSSSRSGEEAVRA